MYEGKSVVLVIPCHNEERQIGKVLRGIPEFVDSVIVVDDASTDDTVEIVRRYAEEAEDGRLTLLRRDGNGGPGAAVSTGYAEALRQGMDVTAVMDGDAQMDPTDLERLVGPVARGETDYAKGNRLFYRGAWETIPRLRYLGNAILSMLTKVASGYWHMADSQSGYTAISEGALRTVDFKSLIGGWAYTNDLLVRLNVYNMRVMDVPVRPIYDVGEDSHMRIWKVALTMPWCLLRLFVSRMWQKYVIHDFHPLVLFYLVAAVLGLVGAGLLVRLLVLWADTGYIMPMNALLWVFCTVSSTQFALFAMWFDMDFNRELCIPARYQDQ
ncbi:MAG: glycosyltransferase family 2 protein [Candidatus Brocadiaceae bacterium]|jgi:glycosyltransferase involved in cell wall biosynthesis